MSLENRIARILNHEFNLDLAKDLKAIAECVVRMSNFYINFPSSATPWNEPWCQISQICYYLPLNYIRTEAALNRSGVSLSHIQDIFDFGCGLSPISWYFYLKNQSSNGPPLRIHLFDQSLIPIRLLRTMELPIQNNKCPSSFDELILLPSTLTSCSYVLTEIQNQRKWNWLLNCRNLFILEPSTRMDARRLMEFRSELIESKFNIQAPCTHYNPCPLLYHSRSDWCHDRTPVNFSFIREIEKHLPFYNKTVTFSYIMASREIDDLTSPLVQNSMMGRVIGDTIVQKGKKKQALCYGKDRTFLTWMDKDWKGLVVEQTPRGSLVEVPVASLEKGTPQNLELRVMPGSKPP